MVYLISLLVLLLIPQSSHALDDYTWFDMARDSYINREVKRYGPITTCDLLGNAAFNAAFERDKGVSRQEVLRSGREYVGDTPFFDLSKFQVYAIDFAYSNPGVDRENIGPYIERRCLRGEGNFSELERLYDNTSLAPEPSNLDVLDFACPYYARWVKIIVNQRDRFEHPLWFTVERTLGTDNGVIPYPMQVELTEYIYNKPGLGSDELSEIIERECYSRRGRFE